MDGFFSQARRNLGPDSSARLEREWPNKVRVVATSQPLLPPKVVPGVFEMVSEALYSNRWVQGFAEAEALLTFEAEKAVVRRARAARPAVD